MTPMRYAGKMSKAEMIEVATHLIEKVGLQDRLKHRPSELSGGQCHRVAISRSMANTPPVLLADEPTGNLDEKTSEDVLNLMLELVAETGAGLLMVTHSPRMADRMDRQLVLTAGQVS